VDNLDSRIDREVVLDNDHSPWQDHGKWSLSIFTSDQMNAECGLADTGDAVRGYVSTNAMLIIPETNTAPSVPSA